MQPLLEHFLAYLVKQEELQLEALHNVFRRRTKAVQARLDELEAQEEYHAHKRSSGPLDEVPPAADTSGVGGDITPPGLPGESTNGAASPEDGYVSVGSSPSSVTRDSPLADASGLSPTVVIRVSWVVHSRHCTDVRECVRCVAVTVPNEHGARFVGKHHPPACLSPEYHPSPRCRGAWCMDVARSSHTYLSQRRPACSAQDVQGEIRAHAVWEQGRVG